MMVKLHPLNAKGKFYVDQDVCTCSAACIVEAPGNFAMGKDDGTEYGAYVFKQPSTPDEEEACRRAMNACPLEAILDDGDLG